MSNYNDKFETLVKINLTKKTVEFPSKQSDCKVDQNVNQQSDPRNQQNATKDNDNKVDQSVDKKSLKRKPRSYAQKIISLKHPSDNPEFLLVDMRSTFSASMKSKGICFTSWEFDYVASCLAFGPDREH